MVTTRYKYVWETEPNACERCQALDGEEFFDEDDIPEKPHPNCKCSVKKVEITDEDDDVTGSEEDDGEESAEEIKEKIESLTRQVQTAKNEVNKGLNEISTNKQKLEEIKNQTVGKHVSSQTLSKIEKGLSELESFKSEGGELLQGLNAVDDAVKVFKIRIVYDKFTKIVRAMRDFFKKIYDTAVMALQKVKDFVIAVGIAIIRIGKEIINNNKLLQEILYSIAITKDGKEHFDRVVNWIGENNNEPDAAGTYLHAAKHNEPTSDYIKQNGRIVDSIDDLETQSLKDLVHKKVERQMKAKDSSGVVFRDDSSFAKNVANSEEFKKFIGGKKTILRDYRRLPDSSIVFEKDNLYHAMHRADVVDIHLDDDRNLLAKFIDTVDYNEGDPNFLVRIAREYQLDGRLKPYYFIINVKIPPSVWQNF